MSQVIVGLDIGTTKIACFVGRMNEHGKIEILSMGKSDSLGVSRGVVSNIEKTIDSIELAVKEAQSLVQGQRNAEYKATVKEPVRMSFYVPRK
jgi:cell division protein FtsA